jgi:hypothetical protein
VAFFAASVNVLLQVLTLGLIVLARHDGAAGDGGHRGDRHHPPAGPPGRP